MWPVSGRFQRTLGWKSVTLRVQNTRRTSAAHRSPGLAVTARPLGPACVGPCCGQSWWSAITDLASSSRSQVRTTSPCGDLPRPEAPPRVLCLRIPERPGGPGGDAGRGGGVPDAQDTARSAVFRHSRWFGSLRAGAGRAGRQPLLLLDRHAVGGRRRPGAVPGPAARAAGAGFLAIYGLAGYAIFLVGAILEILGHNVGVALSIPGGLFEIAFGVLLIAKGFPVGQSQDREGLAPGSPPAALAPAGTPSV